MSIGRNKPAQRKKLLNLFEKSKSFSLPGQEDSTNEEEKLLDIFDASLINNNKNIKYLKKTVDKTKKTNDFNSDYVFKQLKEMRSQTILINLSGKEFRTKIENLYSYPTSRLGKISLATSYEQISQLCDGFIPGNPPMIYFDRNPQHFRTILDVYRNREIHVCQQSCPLVVQQDFEFWGLDEILLQPCCSLKYFPQIVSAKKEIEEEEKIQSLAREREVEEDFGNSCLGRCRSKLWDIMEYPETSKIAQLTAFISISFVFISTVCFMVESAFEQETGNDTDYIFDASIDNFILNFLHILDTVAISFFTFEYLLKFMLSPNKKKFLMDRMNLVDLIAILPFYMSLILEGLEDMQIIGKASKIIRLVRVMRILRIFKMVRHFVGLQSLVYTLHQAYKELGLILLIVIVTVLMFSSLVFAFEREGPDADSWSFYDSFWWGLMTLTTVGYHRQPETFLGKLACGLCALCGIFILTLPIPIVVSSFAVCYKSKLWRNEIATRKRLAHGMNKNKKADILFNLATSGGTSGVRDEKEVLCQLALDNEEYENIVVSENRDVMANTPSDVEESMQNK